MLDAEGVLASHCLWVDARTVHRCVDGVLVVCFLLVGKRQEHSDRIGVLCSGFLPYAVFVYHDVVHLGFD